jgi:hypothetical protein
MCIVLNMLQNVSIEHVSLLTCWNAGHRGACKILANVEIHTNFNLVSPSEDKPIDILHLNGSFVGLCEDSSFHIPTNGGEHISDPAPPEVDNHFIDIQLENVLPKPDDDNDDAVFNKSRMWLDVDGKPVHKSSAVSSLLGLENLLKSKDRLRKV